MTEETYTFLETLLYDSFAQMNATYLHFKHQLSLPAKYRIEISDEHKLEETKTALKQSMDQIENTIAELKQEKHKLLGHDYNSDY